jgi:hypothetical protein
MERLNLQSHRAPLSLRLCSSPERQSTAGAVAAIPRLARPHLVHDPSRLRRSRSTSTRWSKARCQSSAFFRLEHHGLIRGRDAPEQRQRLIRQRAAGRVIPKLQELPMDLADAIGDLQPVLTGDAVWPECGGMHVEDRRPPARDAGFHPPAAGSPYLAGVSAGWFFRLDLSRRRREVEHADSITLASFRLSRLVGIATQQPSNFS